MSKFFKIGDKVIIKEYGSNKKGVVVGLRIISGIDRFGPEIKSIEPTDNKSYEITFDVKYTS